MSVRLVAGIQAGTSDMHWMKRSDRDSSVLTHLEHRVVTSPERQYLIVVLEIGNY